MALQAHAFVDDDVAGGNRREVVGADLARQDAQVTAYLGQLLDGHTVTSVHHAELSLPDSSGSLQLRIVLPGSAG
jgi:hypothetical protein